MNLESFEYSLQASGFGVFVVFSALVCLCLLMYLLKTLFPESAKKGNIQPGAAIQPSAVVAASQEPEEWIFVAATAYLLWEQEQIGAPKASPWSASGRDNSNHWVADNSFLRNRV